MIKPSYKTSYWKRHNEPHAQLIHNCIDIVLSRLGTLFVRLAAFSQPVG
ncbi:hypothetical protein VCRA2123O444_100023 [Vibrio crassostreae]|nr:hypothetical protein VCRA2119O431_100023 [Vibrio crassostreae]CAK1705840.1 hypothetical protein VCRA2114O422_100132 [Vibrio crassostreae]CAK1724763.1 hypothetical protein VCRA2113O409_110132 [Vibrio crassostreae]CAK1729284.1 hypothetical protein VCRA2117O428_120023 [Vibrio crassostreae]CAK1729871.1 hypothetical protein VCRA2113O416_120024 [Vibrio crassostreae]